MTLYPGLGLPLRHYPREDEKFYPLGLHQNCPDSHSALLPVREVAMMNIMEQLTNKENWHNMIFNDEIVNQWRKEALERPNRVYWQQAIAHRQSFDGVQRPPGIMDVATFDYCVKELRNKANYFVETGLIPTLEASAAMVKSDVLVSVSLRAELQKAFNRLKLDQISKPNWHPKSHEQLLDLVHPSMHPLVYGRTRVLQDEVVGVSDAIYKWAGKGEPIAKDTSNPSREEYAQAGLPPPSFWSDTYQWLPANVKFMDHGTVKFTSYINNLHPQKYPQIYRTIEKLIEAALPAWDQCLSLPLKRGRKHGAGRTEPRFPKQDVNDNVPGIWDPSSPPPLDDVDEAAGDDEEEDGEENEDSEEHDEYVDYADYDDDDEYDEYGKKIDPAILEWRETRKPVHPCVPEFEEIEYAQRDTARLAQKFKKTGLQVIVKMVSIELTPEKPEIPAGEWHVGGQMNERICATALYCVDSENVAPSSINFRMQTSYYATDSYETVTGRTCSWLQSTHGTFFGYGRTSSRLQMYGAVQMQEGRLIAYPNVFQHKESSIKLKDPSKPGTRHLISLRLVDPSMRIISTANVPPQQRDWWAGAVLRQPLRSEGSMLAKISPDPVSMLELPVEILDMIRAYLYKDESFLPMDEEEARKHRAELLQEHIEHHTRAWLLW